jgi:hypothetical protein
MMAWMVPLKSAMCASFPPIRQINYGAPVSSGQFIVAIAGEIFFISLSA